MKNTTNYGYKPTKTPGAPKPVIKQSSMSYVGGSKTPKAVANGAHSISSVKRHAGKNKMKSKSKKKL